MVHIELDPSPVLQYTKFIISQPLRSTAAKRGAGRINSFRGTSGALFNYHVQPKLHATLARPRDLDNLPMSPHPDN